MKKVLLSLAVVFAAAFSANAQTTLFYTDFVSTPSDLAAKVSAGAEHVCSDPFTGTNWTIAGHGNNKLAKSTQKPFANGVTTLSETGRLSFGGAAGYFTVKEMQGPFSVDIYWGTTNTARTLNVTIGSNDPVVKSAAAASTNYKETFTYTGTDKIDVKIGCAGGSIYLYDVLITSNAPSGKGDIVADKGTVVDEVFHTLLGAKVSESNLVAGQVYIKTTTYDNGLVETTKEMKQ